MTIAAETLGLRWTSDSPPGHPYGAQLDGQLFKGGARLAVVELAAIHFFLQLSEKLYIFGVRIGTIRP
jgi:hypothetical protein